MVGVIFRPYGRKSCVIIRHFPSVAEFRYFPSVQTDGATIITQSSSTNQIN